MDLNPGQQKKIQIILHFFAAQLGPSWRGGPKFNLDNNKVTTGTY